MPLEDFLGAGSSALGSVMGFLGAGKQNKAAQALMREQNEFNAAEAHRNRDFQRDMSNSAYQRATADMREAGLNPMLAYTQGGSSTPSGSTASGASTAPVQDEIGKAMSTAESIGQMIKELDLAKSQKGLQTAQTGAAEKQAELNASSARAAEADTERTKVETARSLETLPLVREQVKTGVKQEKWNQKAVDFDNYSRRIRETLGGLNSAKDLLNPFKGIFGEKTKDKPFDPDTFKDQYKPKGDPSKGYPKEWGP